MYSRHEAAFIKDCLIWNAKREVSWSWIWSLLPFLVGLHYPKRLAFLCDTDNTTCFSFLFQRTPLSGVFKSRPFPAIKRPCHSVNQFSRPSENRHLQAIKLSLCCQHIQMVESGSVNRWWILARLELHYKTLETTEFHEDQNHFSCFNCAWDWKSGTWNNMWPVKVFAFYLFWFHSCVTWWAQSPIVFEGWNTISFSSFCGKLSIYMKGHHLVKKLLPGNSGGFQEFWPQGGGAWAQNLLKITVFPFNLPENCMI